jgi:hypothetical protein
MCSKTRDLIGRLSQTKLFSLRRSGGLLPSLLIQNALVALEENELIGTEEARASRPHQPRRSRLSRSCNDDVNGDDFCVPCDEEFPDAFDTDIADAAVPNAQHATLAAAAATEDSLAITPAVDRLQQPAEEDVLMTIDSETEQNLLMGDDDDTPLNEYDLFMAEFDSVCCNTSNVAVCSSSPTTKRSYPEDDDANANGQAAEDFASVKFRRTPSIDSPMIARRSFASTVIVPLVCA